VPWAEPAAEQIRAAWSHGRLHHALLIHGADGLGKRAFAVWLGRALLCETKTDTLESLRSLRGLPTHSGGFASRPADHRTEEDKQQISIDQIRQTCEALA